MPPYGACGAAEDQLWTHAGPYEHSAALMIQSNVRRRHAQQAAEWCSYRLAELDNIRDWLSPEEYREKRHRILDDSLRGPSGEEPSSSSSHPNPRWAASSQELPRVAEEAGEPYYTAPYDDDDYDGGGGGGDGTPWDGAWDRDEIVRQQAELEAEVAAAEAEVRASVQDALGYSSLMADVKAAADEEERQRQELEAEVAAAEAEVRASVQDALGYSSLMADVKAAADERAQAAQRVQATARGRRVRSEHIPIAGSPPAPMLALSSAHPSSAHPSSTHPSSAHPSSAHPVDTTSALEPRRATRSDARPSGSVVHMEPASGEIASVGKVNDA